MGGTVPRTKSSATASTPAQACSTPDEAPGSLSMREVENELVDISAASTSRPSSAKVKLLFAKSKGILVNASLTD